MTIDTLRLSRRLNEAGMPAAQADALAETLGEDLRLGVASKQDVETLGHRMDLEFAALEEKLSGLDDRVGAVEVGLANLERRFDVQFAQIDGHFVRIDERFARIDEQVEQQNAWFERRLKEELALQSSRMDDRFRTWAAEMEARVDAKLETHTATIARHLERQTAHLEARQVTFYWRTVAAVLTAALAHFAAVWAVIAAQLS